jgi:hypothetical protein
MPWYLNITRLPVRSELADGTPVYFDPRQRKFIYLSQLSEDIRVKINEKKLRYVGGGQDMEPQLSVTEEITAEVQPVLVASFADDESKMLSTNDIEETLDTSGDGGPDRDVRKRRKRQ